MIFDSADIYIDSACSLKDKIKRMDQVIAALETTALRAASGSDISEYSLNDGQVQIRTVYRSVDDIMASIAAFERMRTYYKNKLNGRSFRLMDGKNFNR
jgi:hypothetical protein